MKATQELHDLGQSLWLDNITRGVLRDGTLKRYLAELSVTGLTSNPTVLAAQLQGEGTSSFGNSWKDLLDLLVAKGNRLLQRDRAATSVQ
jgi:transaldolase